MPPDNVEIARRVCAAAWRRPKPDFDTLNSLVHTDHEMFTVQSLVEGGSYRGAQGFREWLLSWSEMFGEEWECRVEEAEEIEDEGVLVTGRISVRGVGGGVPVDQRFWMIQRFGAGKVSRSQIYTDREQAAQAAGLGT